MAGDWIKMRVDIGDDPAVIGMASSLGCDEDVIVGKLHRLWSWADRHTTDGFAIGINARWVDKYVAMPGFADALSSVKWIVFSDSGVEFPNFDRHNGKSAKARCEAAIRQRLSRKNRDDGVTGDERTNIPRPFVSAVLERDEYRCGYCGAESDKDREASKKRLLSVDHIVPVSRGGRSSVDNLLTCCKLCNNEKNDRTPEEWGLSPRFLSDGVTYESQKICDNRVTNALPEKRREEKKKEGGPTPARPDLEFIFSDGLDSLLAGGLNEREARAVLGKMVKDFGEAETATALQAAIGKADVKTYALAILTKKRREAKEQKRFVI